MHTYVFVCGWRGGDGCLFTVSLCFCTNNLAHCMYSTVHTCHYSLQFDGCLFTVSLCFCTNNLAHCMYSTVHTCHYSLQFVCHRHTNTVIHHFICLRSKTIMHYLHVHDLTSSASVILAVTDS